MRIENPLTLKARINYTIDVYISDFIEVREEGFYKKWNFHKGNKETAEEILKEIGNIFGVKVNVEKN